MPDGAEPNSEAPSSGPDAASAVGPERREPPLTEFHRGLEECVGKLGGRVKHCGLSAFHHLRRAWALHGVDNEMSAFRAITAEEEAASALILSLQQKRYPGAGRLNFRDHLHKAALTPFFNAVAKVLALTDFAKPTLRLSPDADPPRVTVFMDMSRAGVRSPEPLFAESDEPLNFVVRMEGKDGTSGVHMFEEQLREVTRGNSLDEIVAFLREEAKRRNRLLYASDTGILAVTFMEGFLLERLRRVAVLLMLTIAIQQTPTHQLFAVQCLKAFLRALRKIDGEPFDFGDADPARLGIVIHKEPDREPVAWLGWRHTFRTAVGHQLLPVMHVGWNYAGSTRRPAGEPGAPT